MATAKCSTGRKVPIHVFSMDEWSDVTPLIAISAASAAATAEELEEHEAAA